MPRSTWLVNGRDSLVHPSDRGLCYGDGLFETMAARDGRIRWLDRHFDRLRNDAARLGIGWPGESLLAEEIASLCPDAGAAVVKLVLTRGPGARGYRPPASPHTTRIVSVSAWPDYPDSHYTAGIELAVLETRVAESAALAGIKHLGRLEQVLAQAETAARGLTEGVMLDQSGYVAGGTMSNVFVVSRGTIATPVLDTCGVSGVMRRVVIEHADSRGLRVAVRRVSPEDLRTADEVFVTNAVFGLWPVRRVGSRLLEPGPVSRLLIEELGVGPHAP